MIKNIVAIMLMSASLTGCLSVKMYVDPELPKVDYADLKPVENKHPVQLFYEFQSKGAVNAAATKETQPMAVDVLQKSSLFSQVNTAPATSEYKLFVTIDNVPVTKDATSKGVATGLTFGLAGNMVTDGYLCKVSYQAPGKTSIDKSYKHAIHTTIGNADGPKGLQPYKPQDAVRKLVEDLMLNALNDIDKEGAL
jgi:hypothetical protein